MLFRSNLEQERGGQAWADIRKVKQPGEEARDLLEKEQDGKLKKQYENLLKKYKKLQQEYRSLARGLNAMIQINGLGQTLGFLKAKGGNDPNKAHFLLLTHLTDWMRTPGHFSATNLAAMNDGQDGLLIWVVDAGTNSTDYRRATVECLAFGGWLRRFAEAELEEPKPGEEE